uniref:Uncharacterized protein n=1 Tax=Arundo donax TaxID=35708 RepID=A0A0A9HWJ7_ARUDO
MSGHCPLKHHHQSWRDTASCGSCGRMLTTMRCILHGKCVHETLASSLIASQGDATRSTYAVV